VQQRIDKVNLFGVPVDALTMSETVERIRALVREGRPRQHVVLNAAKVVELRRNPELAKVITACDVVNADGAAVVWASCFLGRKLPERVTGIDLMERLLAAAARDRHSVYFLGARPEVVKRVAEVAQARHPRLGVAGYQDGYWKDDHQVIQAVRQAGPQYLFLAIPSPRKELWLNRHLDKLGVPFVMGVGGSFDILAGATRRAPSLLRRTGLEWTWRLAQEPRRMWKRYLVGNTQFIALVLRERLQRGVAS